MGNADQIKQHLDYWVFTILR